MKNKILVTGGAGFLGSHVVKLLLEYGFGVVVIDDLSNGKLFHLKDELKNKNLDLRIGNITSALVVNEAIQECNIVIHLAVLDLRQSIRDPQNVIDVIINGTFNCLEAAKNNDIELFMNCSSSEVYGTAHYVPMDENHPLFPETPYAAAKVAQDALVHSYGRTYNLNWQTIRPFNMYGPNSYWQGYRGELIPRMIIRAMNNQPLVVFGNGEQTRDFVYVEDAAKAIVDMVMHPIMKNDTVNFCSGKETSIKRIAELICDEFKLDYGKFIKEYPERPGDVRRHLGSNAKFLSLYNQRNFVGINEGLKKTINWILSMNVQHEELLYSEPEINW